MGYFVVLFVSVCYVKSRWLLHQCIILKLALTFPFIRQQFAYSTRKFEDIKGEQWPKEKGQTMIFKTLLWKLKTDQHYNPTKTGVEHRCSGRVRNVCSTHTVISHEWGKDRIVNTTNRTNMWSFVTNIFRNGNGQLAVCIYDLIC